MRYNTVLDLSSPFFTQRALGFEGLFNRLNSLASTTDKSSGYPPYNIRRDGDKYQIEVAVAGLSEDDIKLELSEGVLTISHELSDDQNSDLVHRGIAQRAFRQQFTLAEDIEVKGATLKHGLLSIELERLVPEARKPRLIAINGARTLKD